MIMAFPFYMTFLLSIFNDTVQAHCIISLGHLGGHLCVEAHYQAALHCRYFPFHVVMIM